MKTELVFILDKSGSMSGLEKDTIGGFNSLVAKQRKEEGEAIITTVLFDHDCELLHDRIDMDGISPMTEEEYRLGGTTALLDAIGMTIQKIAKAHQHTKQEVRPEKVLVVITTDGMENASREFTIEKVRHLVSDKQKTGWEFLFLGANIDALSTADSYGIKQENAVNFHADEAGMQLNYQVVNEAVSSFRQGRKLEKSWKQEIEQDFETRK
ncbi:vWA domain-containing protein [Paenisporosarcina cavernae]|uniref:VWA domain-containing protein n=1 Tax=Paenisporosarcina cavernae TaxID=2320858 RepID=A0A385YPB1_9BACL|nr:vWA domain-containing protein [Paenisporosarcina cavernae]AYC28535.1 VWA domain-containing protein [Paenisporosarcina cavernae]